MVDVKELRIGNWVLFNNEWQMLDLVGLTGAVGLMGNAITNSQEQIEPIPLTPTILMQCGFIDPARNGGAYRKPVNSQDELCWYMDDGFPRYQTQGSGFTRQLQHIKYLHQLMNWWYSFVGEELIIKL